MSQCLERQTFSSNSDDFTSFLLLQRESIGYAVRVARQSITIAPTIAGRFAFPHSQGALMRRLGSSLKRVKNIFQTLMTLPNKVPILAISTASSIYFLINFRSKK